MGYDTLDQPALRLGRCDKAREQRMGLERARLQLGVILHTDEPGMIDEFDRLRQKSVWRHAGKPKPRRLKPLAIGRVHLVAVAVPLGNLGRTVDVGEF